MPLRDDAVDLVFASMVLHHFDDVPRVLAESRRVLRDGGCFYLRAGTRERISSYPTSPHFPASVPIMERMLWTVDRIREAFELEGFQHLDTGSVDQVISSSHAAYAERLAAGGDSVLAQLSKADFDAGVASVRDLAATVDPEPVLESIDFLVFGQETLPGRLEALVEEVERCDAGRAVVKRQGTLWRSCAGAVGKGGSDDIYMKVRSRPVARVVVLDPLDRILLFETRLVYTHVWMTPGGGVKPGESFAEGARRELWEEIGVQDFDLGPCVWTVRFRFEYQNEVIDQREQYFVARLDSADVVDTNREEAERVEILRHRWWTCAELQDAEADFRPRELATLLPAVISGDLPRDPVTCSVEGSASVI